MSQTKAGCRLQGVATSVTLVLVCSFIPSNNNLNKYSCCFFSCVASEVTADKGDNSAICTGENGLWKRGCVRLMELNAQDLETTEHYFEVVSLSSG